jgi:hypothetical protein
MPEMFSNFWFLVAVTIIVTSVVATLAQAWQKVRRAEQEVALKHEMLRRGLTVEEIDRLLRAGSKSSEKAAAPANDEGAVEALTESLGECGASPQLIEQVLAAVRDAEPSFRQTICGAVQGVIRGSNANTEEKIVAVIRGLSPAPAPPPEADSAPGARPAPAASAEEAFQLTRPA